MAPLQFLPTERFLHDPEIQELLIVSRLEGLPLYSFLLVCAQWVWNDRRERKRGKHEVKKDV